MINYRRQNDESFIDYCHRISSQKQELQLTWDEIADIINNEFGLHFSETYYRKKEKNYQEIMQDCSDEDLYLQYKLEIAKEKVKLSDERTQINALIRKLSREETIKEIAQDVVQKLSTVKQLPFTNHDKSSLNNEKEALLLIGDWHYGIEINNCYNTYNTEIARRRLISLQNKVIQKCKLNNITTLNIANLGDMISGNIHLPLRINTRIDVITQVIEVSELLCEFISNLSEMFQINYVSVSDNHSRIDPDKNNSLDLESLYRITNWYVRQRFKELNYENNLYGEDIAIMEILGHPIAFVHGHNDKQSVVIDKLASFTQQHFDMICTAHMHHFSADENCDTIMIANGSLMGTDDYAFKRRLHSKPSQNLIIISREDVLDDLCKLNLNVY